ncbi:unnamed protein product [Rotaria sp. Silwood2]|nr:unnamed protein product [Rotaria sp. Silwood2]CAF3886482.1 unnamed protein product [Rotaria sp. Silwood2]
MAENNSTEHIEDEAIRHRRERRELQSTVQQLKKSINKNDKTRKKKIDSEIKALEEAFEKRWEHFNENSTITTQSNIATDSIQSNETLPETDEKQQHVSRKARRLVNKEKRQAEIDANQEVIDYDSQPEAIRSRNESLSINEQLHERGLELHSIVSDGNCLFASIVNQISDLNVRQLREQVAEYLRKHRNDYEPFIDTDYDMYCEKLAKENVWGGQIELQICAKILQRSIEIIQGNGNEPIKIGYPTSSEPPIIITYHRYLYANGEHYNSTMRTPENDDE